MVAAGDEIVAADITEIEDLTIRKPLVRMVQTVAQSIPDATVTAMTFTTEDIDTHGFHDTVTNNTRITPNVAGYYTIRGAYFSAAPTTLVDFDCSLRKNGSTSLAPGNRGNAGGIVQSQACATLVSFNGSTDYVELMAQQNSSGAVLSNVSVRFSSVFEAIFERSL